MLQRQLSRAALGRGVCEREDRRNPKEELCTASARNALPALAPELDLPLPPAQPGPPRVVSIASKQNLAQQPLVQALDSEELIGSLSKPLGKYATPQPKRWGINALQTFQPRSQ